MRKVPTTGELDMQPGCTPQLRRNSVGAVIFSPVFSNLTKHPAKDAPDMAGVK
jgi:hypothetical protein